VANVLLKEGWQQRGKDIFLPPTGDTVKEKAKTLGSPGAGKEEQ
jgi:hypothetical protein